MEQRGGTFKGGGRVEGEEEQVVKGPTRRFSQRPACGTEATLLSAMKQSAFRLQTES